MTPDERNALMLALDEECSTVLIDALLDLFCPESRPPNAATNSPVNTTGVEVWTWSPDGMLLQRQNEDYCPVLVDERGSGWAVFVYQPEKDGSFTMHIAPTLVEAHLLGEREVRKLGTWPEFRVEPWPAK